MELVETHLTEQFNILTQIRDILNGNFLETQVNSRYNQANPGFIRRTQV